MFKKMSRSPYSPFLQFIANLVLKSNLDKELLYTRNFKFLAAMSSSSSDNVTQSVRLFVRPFVRPFVSPCPFSLFCIYQLIRTRHLTFMKPNVT